MTPPIPQRVPMLALPEPKAVYIPELNVLFTNIPSKIVICRIKNVGRNTWYESHNFKGGYF